MFKKILALSYIDNLEKATKKIWLSASYNSAYRSQAIIRNLRALGKVRQRLVPTDTDTRRRRRISAQTDELPSPLRDI